MLTATCLSIETLEWIAEAIKERARIGGPPVAVETGCAMVNLRGAAESFLVDNT
jgi:hypothetical protein